MILGLQAPIPGIEQKQTKDATQLNRISSVASHMQKEAHKPDQTDQPSPGTDLSDIRTHQAETQTKAVARDSHRCSADPTWKGLRLSFGGNDVLILQKVVIHVDGGNRPLEL